MKSRAFLGFISAAVLVVLMGGCAVFSTDQETTLPENDLLFASNLEDAALLAPTASPTSIPQEMEEELQTEDKAGLKEQQVKALVANFIQEGKNFMDKSLLEEAQAQFAHALELDPGNEEAKELFNFVGTKLGNRPETISTVAKDARDRAMVRRTQNRMKAEELKKAGVESMNTYEFDKAIRFFEDALLIVHWNPYLDEGVLNESELQGLLENSKKKLDDYNRDRDAELQKRVFKQQQNEDQAEKARLENRMNRLYHDANAAFLNERYKECELYLDELLKIDPDNVPSVTLKSLSMRSRHAAKKESTTRKFKKEWRKTFDDLEYDDLPQTDLVVYPSDEEWEKISLKGRSEMTSSEDVRSTENEAVFQKLASTPVAANFEETTLEEVVDYLKAATGVNFLISTTITESGDDYIFDVVNPPRPAIEQLELLMDLSTPPLKYEINNGVVKILAAEDPSSDKEMDVYDVRDLAKIIANFPARDFNLRPSSAADEDFEPEGDDDENPEVISTEILAEKIQANIEPTSWDIPGNTIQPIGNFLVVRQSKKVHEKIHQLLSDLRSNAGVLINIETRFISVEDNFLEDIGVDFRGLDGNVNDFSNPLAAVPNVLLDDFGDGSLADGYGSEANAQGIGSGNDAGIYYDDGEDGDLMGRLENLLHTQIGETDILDNSGGTTMQFTFLDDIKLQAILRAVSKRSTCNIIQAPQLTVYNGERANLTYMNHISYIKDFEPEIAQSAVIAEPVVGIVKDGVILDVRPVVSADRRFVTIELRPTIAILKRDDSGSLPTITTNLGVGESITIELPEMEIKRLRTTVTMPDGATLLLGGMKISNEQKFDTGLPFFNKIPIISFFLSRKATYESKRKLLILVSAKIVIPEELEPTQGINK